MVLRIAVVATAVLGLMYLTWRWGSSVPWDRWWLAVPLVLAESVTFLVLLALGATMWRARRRVPPQVDLPVLDVDVVVVAAGESPSALLTTVRAARQVTGAQRTWLVDAAERPEVADAARAAGAGYLTLPPGTTVRSSTTTAAALDVALGVSEAEVVLVLPGDQVPDPDALTTLLPYLTEERTALALAPPAGGAAARPGLTGGLEPFFTGPVQLGRDAWGAPTVADAAVLVRRDPLVQMGLVGYVRDTERQVREALHEARGLVSRAQREAPDDADDADVGVLRQVQDAAARALAQLDGGEPLSDVTFGFQREVDAISSRVVAGDVSAIQEDLAALAELSERRGEAATRAVVVDAAALSRLSGREWSPLGALRSVQDLVRAVDIGVPGAGGSVSVVPATRELGLLLRLQALGWRTPLHPRPVTRGPARVHLPDALVRHHEVVRAGWATLLEEGGRRLRGLSAGQRLVHAASWSPVAAALAALVYLLVPVVALTTGVQPVRAWSSALALHLVGYAVAAQLLLALAAGRLGGWRARQPGVALGTVWLSAALGAVRDTLRPGAAPGRASSGRALVLPSRVLSVLLLLAVVVGLLRAGLGHAPWTSTVVLAVWALVDVALLAVVATGHRATARPRR